MACEPQPLWQVAAEAARREHIMASRGEPAEKADLKVGDVSSLEQRRPEDDGEPGQRGHRRATWFPFDTNELRNRASLLKAMLTKVRMILTFDLLLDPKRTGAQEVTINADQVERVSTVRTGPPRQPPARPHRDDPRPGPPGPRRHRRRSETASPRPRGQLTIPQQPQPSPDTLRAVDFLPPRRDLDRTVKETHFSAGFEFFGD